MTVHRVHHSIDLLTARVMELRARVATYHEEPAEIALRDLQESLEDLREAERDLLAHQREDVAARTAIEHERARYAELLEFSSDACLVTDTDGQVEEANHAAAHLLHTGLPQLRGEPLARFIQQSDRAVFRAWLSDVLARGERRERVFVIQPRRRALVHALFAARRFTDRPTGRTVVRWQIRDITNQVVAERRAASLDEEVERRVEHRTEELRRANAIKDELLGLVSHELKTPITTIYGNAQVIRRRADKLTAEDRATAIADIEEEAARLQRLVDDLLILARIGTGDRLAIEPLHAAAVVGRVAEDHRRHYPHREIEVRHDRATPIVAAEPVYFEQVMRNLLSNAEKYSPPNTPIVVRISRSADTVVIAVLDEGPGIAPDEAEAIFAPFFRSARTVRAAAGAGIGLAVCRRLVEAQGGRIWARPRHPRGSEISFSLPIFVE